MTMLLALALALQTLAAEPPCVAVHLPVGESAEEWEAPLELAGLCQVADTVPASVAVVDQDGWCVIEASGSHRKAAVTCPQAPAEREDLAWLAASLARDPPSLRFAPSQVTAPPAAVAPPPTVAPPRPSPPPRAAPTPPPVLQAPVAAAPASAAPAPQPEHEPPPEVATAAVPVAAVPVVEPEEPPILERPPAPRSAHAYAEAGATAEIRPDSGPSLGLHVAGGLARPGLRLAVALGASAPHALSVEGEERRVQSTALVGTAAYRRGVLLAGVGLGASLRRYWDERTSSSGLVPVGRLELRATALAAGAFRIEPALRAQIDLRSTTLAVNGEPVIHLSPWGVQLLIAVVYPP